MAIWQYKIFIVPEEEINSYFERDNAISFEALNEISWWKYEKLDVEVFDVFKILLPVNKSWSKDIFLLGDESSNCIELLIDDCGITEVSVRVDLRFDYHQFVQLLCEFAKNHKLIFLNDDLKILNPSSKIVEDDIDTSSKYKFYMNKFK